MTGVRDLRSASAGHEFKALSIGGQESRPLPPSFKGVRASKQSYVLVAMALASKMQLLHGSTFSRKQQQQKKNELISVLQWATRRGSRSADPTASDSFRLRLRLGVCAGVNRSAHSTSSSPSPPALSGNFHGSSAKGNRSSSHLCQVLDSALEAQARVEADASRAYLDSFEPEPEPEPVRNEEAEGFFRIPIENLRVLLRLWDIDIDNDKTSYYELLAVADYLERLGLDVYFREEIKTILHRVFRVWTENSLTHSAELLGDLQAVGLAFYLLRSHEYDVQPSIFHLYREEDGSFCKTPPQDSGKTAASADVIDMINLVRASDLKFPGESILQDASRLSRAALSGLLDGAEPLSENTSAEVQYRLSYPWALNFRMLETRHTVMNFEVESVTVRFSSVRLSSEVISLMLSTATQLFNHYHAGFQLELEDCTRWSEESGLAEFNVRPQMVLRPFLLGIAYEMPQARYAYTRGIWSKLWYLIILLDDFYESSSSYDMNGIVVFMDAFREFDPSILEKRIPNFHDEKYRYMKVLYYELYDLTKEWAAESSKCYGRDLLRTFVDTWMVRLEIYLNEKKWMEEKYNFTVEQYVEEYSQWSFAAECGLPLGFYSIPGCTFSRSFFETRPDMKAIFALSKAARYFNDARSHEYEKAEGKPGFINILMKENPDLTEEEALAKTQELGVSRLEDSAEAILRGRIPHEAKQLLLSNFRTAILMYFSVDGLRNTDWPLSELCDPLPILTAES